MMKQRMTYRFPNQDLLWYQDKDADLMIKDSKKLKLLGNMFYEI